MGAVPKLCELVRVHHCVEAIGALRNIAANTSAASAAGAAGAMEILADVIRSRAKVEESRLNAEDKRVVYATASAMRALTVKHDANAEILRSLQDVADIVSQFCEGMRIE
jgi:RNA-splicing ligase RtcB